MFRSKSASTRGTDWKSLRTIALTVTAMCLSLIVAPAAFADPYMQWSSGLIPATSTTPLAPNPFSTDVAAVTACEPIKNSSYGVIFRNTEDEQDVTVNPQNPNQLITTFHQDAWEVLPSNQVVPTIGAAYSHDGGLTWQRSNIPMTTCTGNDRYEKAFDPIVQFSPDGLSAYAVQENVVRQSGAGVFKVEVTVSSSSNGGVTWSQPVRITQLNPNGKWEDGTMVATDPANPDVVYVAFRDVSTGGSPHFNSYIAESRNRGATWSTRRLILKGGAVLGLARSSRGVIVAELQDRSGNAVVVRSLDNGVTWSAPTVITAYDGLSPLDLFTGFTYRVYPSITNILAYSPAGDRLYFVTQKRGAAGQRAVLFLYKSDDDGVTWSGPAAVSSAYQSPPLKSGLSRASWVMLPLMPMVMSRFLTLICGTTISPNLILAVPTWIGL